MKVWNGEDTRQYSHVKRDGWLIMAEVSKTGQIKYWSSSFRPLDLSFLPHHADIFEYVRPGTILHCELWKPGKVASYTSSGIANRDTELRLDVFGIESKDVPVGTPLETLADIVESHYRMSFIPFEKGVLGKEHIYADAEGWVYNNGNMRDLVKFKPFKDATLKIVGVEAGKGKFSGMIGSLEVATADGTVVCNVSGMTDTERQLLTIAHLSGKLVGTLCDVSYQYVNSKGKLRHGSFIRLREDKIHADSL